ncbi:hypothetical protein K0M31_003484 [Melipona bicolor]|uniref:Uncharacterized protein n=1 Tax=Melipona bicolor TaxID=60889 RepID=A0AA40KPJ1_9HYME|nr:hypothetical protein K0M31_003484 [Melipona bicolor]
MRLTPGANGRQRKMSKKRNPWKICVNLPRERRRGEGEKGRRGEGEQGRAGVLIPAGGSFEPSREPAKLFFLSKSGRASVRPASESRFDGTRCRIAGLQTPPPPAKQQSTLSAAFEPADKVRAHKPVKCEFKMLPGDVHSAEYPLVPDTLCLAGQLYSNFAEN